MRVELMIEGQEDVTWPQWLALAQACEEHGVGTLFRSDHYLSVEGHDERGSLETWATLAGLAAVTSRLRLGALVSPATFRHPSVLAKLVTAVDHISNGRVELGLGAGWNEREHEAYGFAFPPLGERMEMLEEQLAIVRGAWADGPFSFAGKHYRLDALDARPKPVQRPHPPVIIGGGAKPRTARLAAQFADEYNTVYATPGRVRRAPRRGRAGVARRGPRSGDDDVLGHGAVALRRRRRRPPAARRAARRLARTRTPASLLEEFAGLGVTGTFDEALARLRELPRRRRRPHHAAAPAARRRRRHRACSHGSPRRSVDRCTAAAAKRRPMPRRARPTRARSAGASRRVASGSTPLASIRWPSARVQPSSISSVGSGWNWMPHAWSPTRKACSAPRRVRQRDRARRQLEAVVVRLEDVEPRGQVGRAARRRGPAAASDTSRYPHSGRHGPVAPPAASASSSAPRQMPRIGSSCRSASRSTSRVDVDRVRLARRDSRRPAGRSRRRARRARARRGRRTGCPARATPRRAAA